LLVKASNIFPPKKERIEAMKDRKIRIKAKDETNVMTEDIRHRLELIDKDLNMRLETLDYILTGSKDYPEEFLQLYVQPLLESGLSFEDSLSLLVDGVLRPH
jgi:hypothetical protein